MSPGSTTISLGSLSRYMGLKGAILNILIGSQSSLSAYLSSIGVSSAPQHHKFAEQQAVGADPGTVVGIALNANDLVAAGVSLPDVQITSHHPC